MKFKWNNKYFLWGLTAFLVIVAALVFNSMAFSEGKSVVLALFATLIRVLSPVIYGFVMAYLMNPILNFYEKKTIPALFIRLKLDTKKIKRKKMIRNISVLLTLASALIVIGIFFQIIIPAIAQSIRDIATKFPSYVDNFTIWVEAIFNDNPDIEKILGKYIGDSDEYLTGFLSDTLLPNMNNILKSLSNSVFSIAKVAWNLVIGLIISIYVMSNRELFGAQAKKMIYAYNTPTRAKAIIDEVSFIHKTFSGFIGGKIIDSVIIGILCFIVTSIIGTPYSALVSLLVGVTNIIPFFGPFLGAVPSAILILLVNPMQCLYFLIVILILQQLDGNVIGPKILGDSTGLSSFWVIFSITLAGGLFGVLGMFLGVPIFAVIYAEIKKRVNKRLISKGMSADTNDYKGQVTASVLKAQINEEAPADTGETEMKDNNSDKDKA
ncbi:MAG: AI-2E family transporter [Lachnospiraceae bacterium]|nr:AI-2E family transporter [Lachnospiraceae bacterium]